MRALATAALFVWASAPGLAEATPKPAPTPDEAARVGANQKGLRVELQPNASTGASLAASAKPGFLGKARSLSGPTTVASHLILGAPS